MASLVLGVVGGVVGFVGSGGNPMGAMIGFSLGSAAGGVLFPPKGPDGPRLNDLSVQSSTYGKGIPISYGKTRIAGNIIWADKIQEHAQDNGGKGGPEYTTYSYTCSFATSICEGPIKGISRIWADGLLIYDSRKGDVGAKLGFKATSHAFYLGTEDQLPDPTIQALIGDTPAYRGQAYVVFTDLELGKFGNRIPSLSFETGADVIGRDYSRTRYTTVDGQGGDTIVYNLAADTVWSADEFGGFAIYDPVTGESVGHTSGFSGRIGSGIQANPIYDPITKSIYVMTFEHAIARFNAQTGAYVRTYDVNEAANFTISPVNGNIWVSTGSNAETELIEYSQQTGGVVFASNTLTAPGDDGSSRSFSNVVVDKRNIAYVATADQVYRTNRDTRNLDAAPGSAEPNGWAAEQLAYDSVTDSIWYITSPFDTEFYYPGQITSVSPGTVTTITYSPLHAADPYLDTGRMVSFPEGHGYPSLKNAYAMITSQGGGTFTVPIDTSADVQQTFNASQDYVLPNTGRLYQYSLANESITRVVQVDNSGFSLALQLAFDPYRGVMWVNDDNSGNLIGISVADGSVYQVVNEFHVDEADHYMYAWSFNIAPTAIWINSSTYEDIYRVQLSAPSVTSTINLGAIVSDISVRAGLSTADINVEELTDLVDGYTISHQMAARSAIEPLMQAYFFDPVESDYQVQFRKRGRPAVATIPDDDLAAHAAGSDVPDLVQVKRKQELDLPQSVSVKYQNLDADYQTGTQYERRQTGRSQSDVTVDLPIVMPDMKAKQIAAAALYSAWAERTGLTFATSLKYSALEPTDMAIVHGRLVRIVHKKRNGGIIEWEAYADGNTIYPSDAISQGGASSPAGPVDQTIPTVPTTELVAIDAPITMEGTTTPTLTFAVQGQSTGFAGAQIFKSIDGGASYQPVASAPNASLIGTATNALGTYAGGDTFDEINTVTVSLLPSSTGATLSSATELAVLNGANAALVGDEVLQYKRAVLNDDGTYTLSGLLRYRRGTDYAVHAAGERFVPLTSSLVQIPMSTAEIGLPRQYKAVSIGGTLSAAQPVTLTYTGADLKPYSPVHIGGWRDTDGNLMLSWVRRTRVSGEWRDGIDVPLAESTEAYDVEILNSSGAVVRTFSGVTSPTVEYSAGQQIADFGSLQPIVSIRVYQLSSIVGRGFPSTGTV